MKSIKKIQTFLSLSMRQKLLFLEAFCYLGYGRILKLLPFSKIAPSLGEYMRETNTLSNQCNQVILKNISDAIHVMSGYTFWESQCLVKAIAGMKMLERRKIESTLYLGTSKDKDGKFIAHAWLRSGSSYITGLEGMEKFTIVGKFSKEITNKKVN